jgi:membrane protein
MDNSGSQRSRVSEGRRIAGRIVESARRNDVLGVTSQMAFHFLFALPPFALFVAALSAFLAAALHVANPADVIIGAVRANLPPAMADALRPDLQRLLAAPRIDLLGFGAIVAIVAATNGTNSLIKGIHRAYDVPENRPFVLRYLVALGLTLLAALGVIVSFAVIFAGSIITTKAAGGFGFGSGAWTVIQLLRWPVVFLALTGSVAALYRFGPNVIVPWRWILLGSAMFALGWLIATAILGLYAGQAGSFGATYGSLGSVIVLMAWFWVTAGLLLLGAELSATVARERSPEEIRRRPAQNRAAAKIKGAEHGAAGAAKGTAQRTTHGGAS